MAKLQGKDRTGEAVLLVTHFWTRTRTIWQGSISETSTEDVKSCIGKCWVWRVLRDMHKIGH